MAETLEEKVNESKRKVEKSLNSLDGIANETSSFLKTAALIGSGVAAPFIGSAVFPEMTRDFFLLSGAWGVGRYIEATREGKSFTSRDVFNELTIGAALTPILYYGYQYVNRIPTDTVLGMAEKAGAYTFLLLPPALFLYHMIEHTVKKLDPLGAFKYAKDNLVETFKNSMYMQPLFIANMLFVPFGLQIPVSAALNVLWRAIAPGRGEINLRWYEALNPVNYLPTDYIKALANVTSKIVYSPLKSIYDIGSAFGKKAYESAPKPSPTPAPAPTH